MQGLAKLHAERPSAREFFGGQPHAIAQAS
jgi:hypothetical protein